jgi:DNA-binding NarL/FixJ family response regulator
MSPDLIISEYYLPALNGSELFRKCKQEQILQDIPFIFLASVTEYAKKSELINKGAVECLLKPFTITELLNRIYSVFTIQSMAHHSVVSKITTIVQESHTDTAIPEEKPQRRTRQTQTQQLQQPQPTELERTATVTLTATQQALFTAAGLSSREQQIALLISEGKSDKQIADELFISAATVATHNKKLFRKLGVHSRVELMNKVR